MQVIFFLPLEEKKKKKKLVLLLEIAKDVRRDALFRRVCCRGPCFAHNSFIYRGCLNSWPTFIHLFILGAALRAAGRGHRLLREVPPAPASSCKEKLLPVLKRRRTQKEKGCVYKQNGPYLHSLNFTSEDLKLFRRVFSTCLSLAH